MVVVDWCRSKTTKEQLESDCFQSWARPKCCSSEGKRSRPNAQIDRQLRHRDMRIRVVLTFWRKVIYLCFGQFTYVVHHRTEIAVERNARVNSRFGQTTVLFILWSDWRRSMIMKQFHATHHYLTFLSTAEIPSKCYDHDYDCLLKCKV